MSSVNLLQGIVLFRLLVRLKVFQLLGIAGISVVVTTLLSQVQRLLPFWAGSQERQHALLSQDGT